MFRGVTLGSSSVDQLLDSVFQDLSNSYLTDKSNFIRKVETRSNYPRLDIYRTKQDLHIEATVPGLTSENIQVEWNDNDNVLIIKGGKSESKKVEQWHSKEIHRSSFIRKIFLHKKCFDCNEIRAKVENGMLLITIPLLLEAEPTNTTQIPIS